MSAIIPNQDACPFIIRDLPNADYHASAGISNSGLSDIAQSPFHFFARHLDPNRPAREETPAQLAGNLAHCAILEPSEFGKRYAVGPDVSRATKEWKAFEASLEPGVQAIKPDDYERAMRQADSVRRLPDVRTALDRGYAEASAYWIDEETGVLCRCRPDWTHTYSATCNILLDVKTYADASAPEFRRQVARMRYHVQDAFYTEGFAKASGIETAGFLFVAVEDKWPFAASVCTLDDAGKLAGSMLAHRDLRTYAECMRTNRWPSYPDSIQTITLPDYAIAAATPGE